MNGPRVLLILTTAAEALTGLFLLAAPSLVVRLLLGSSAAEPVTLARICGVALLTIAVACWPRQVSRSNLQQQCFAMLVYSAGAGLLLASVGLFGPTFGILLWPAAILHVLIAVSLLIVGLPSQDSSAPAN